jgi:hypothetical protein
VIDAVIYTVTDAVTDGGRNARGGRGADLDPTHPRKPGQTADQAAITGRFKLQQLVDSSCHTWSVNSLTSIAAIRPPNRRQYNMACLGSAATP